MTKKRALLLALVLLVLAGIAAVVAWFVPVLKASNVEVVGNTVTTVDEVAAAANVPADANLLRVDLPATARQVAQLPWVASAKASMHLPDTIEIEVTEHQAVLFVRNADGEHLVDEQGRVFVIDTPPPGTVEVTGTGAGAEDEATLKAVVEVVQALDPMVREQVAQVAAPSALELEFKLHDGRSVYFGSTDNLPDKVALMRTALTRPEANLDVSGAPIIAVRP